MDQHYALQESPTIDFRLGTHFLVVLIVDCLVAMRPDLQRRSPINIRIAGCDYDLVFTTSNEPPERPTLMVLCYYESAGRFCDLPLSFRLDESLMDRLCQLVDALAWEAKSRNSQEDEALIARLLQQLPSQEEADS
jgi:hypothetical protein